MSEERPEPMDEDLAALLEAERSAQPPAAALERVWARVASSGGAGGAPAPSKPSWHASHALSLALAAFVLGGAAVAGLYPRLGARSPERIVRIYMPPPYPSASVVTSATAPVAESPVVPISASAPRPPPRASVPAAPAASSSLSAERLLLDQARAALTGREPERALSLLSDHAHRFPLPQLGEEREALAIQALAVAGRYVEARERAVRFRTSTPNSLFLPAVDATMASIP